MEKKDLIYYFSLNREEKEKAWKEFNNIRENILECLEIIFDDPERMERDLFKRGFRYNYSLKAGIKEGFYKSSWKLSERKMAAFACFHGLKCRACRDRDISDIKDIYLKYYSDNYNYFSGEWSEMFTLNSEYLYILLEKEFHENGKYLEWKIENLILHEIIHALLAFVPETHGKSFKILGNYLSERIGLVDHEITAYENSAAFLKFDSDLFVIEESEDPKYNRIWSGSEYSDYQIECFNYGHSEKSLLFSVEEGIKFRNKLLKMEEENLLKFNISTHE